ncbi:MAG: PQQ-like beta-propeller repeat protein [Planctomycetia bacterium]|nr:PQQ-like beta-propeller repeat protein [Planctomycetia bacterium]
MKTKHRSNIRHARSSLIAGAALLLFGLNFSLNANSVLSPNTATGQETTPKKAAEAPAAEKPAEKPTEKPTEKKPEAPAPAKPAVAAPAQMQIQVQGGAGGVIIQGNVQVKGNVQINGGKVVVNGNAFAVNADGTTTPEDTVFRDPPRPLLQRFKRSETLIEEKRYAEAVEELGEILEEPEDYSYNFDNEGSTRRSLKGEALRRIGALPDEGRAAYELQYGAKAKQLLEKAIQTGDERGLAEVSRRYFHTTAGYQATYLLGMHHLDHDRPLAAALSLRRLKDVANVATQYEPELSLKLATSWARAGAAFNATSVLTAAKQNFPSAEFAVAGESRRWFGRLEQPMDWLAKSTLAAIPSAIDATARIAQWAVYRGDAARNAAGTGGSPLLNRRWAVPFANHPDIEKLIESLRKSHNERDLALLPATHPLAVDDVVLMRSLTGLTAVDFRTGKRIWHGAGDEYAEGLLANNSLSANRQDQQPSPLAMLVDERLWRDAAYGIFSSDSSRAYCVEDQSNQQQDAQVQRMVIQAGGRRISGMGNIPSSNRLAAYELASEGKLVWEIGGPYGMQDPNLADTFFLGAPLPLGDRLYVLAETKGEIRLIVLHAATGKFDWAQQLAVANEAADMNLRRTCGLSPSYSDGVLICPTALGAIVAVDVNDRSLLWGFQYPRAGISTRNQVFMAWQMNGRSTPTDNTDGSAIVVATSAVVAYDLADGKQKWSASLPEAAKPSGRGFFNGKLLFLPLSSAEVASLDIEAGLFTARSKSRSANVPGNLICYRGAVISQGTGGLECFFQLEDLRKEVKDKLAATPEDPAALTSSGELLLDEGKVAEAIDVLRSAYRKKEDPRTRDLFLDALLEGLASGLAANTANLADLEALAIGSGKEEAYYRQRALAHEKAGDKLKALEQYLRLVDGAKLSDDTLRTSANLISISRPRWIRARLDAFASSKDDPALVTALQQEIERRRTAALASDDVAQMRRFLDYFGDHAAADALRIKLSGRLVQTDALLEAENLLRAVVKSTDAALAREATARLARLLVEKGRRDDASVYLERLTGPWATEICLEEKNGRDFVAALLGADAGKATTAHDWPNGKVDVSEVRAQTGVSFRTFPLEFRGERGPYFGRSVIEMDQPQQALVGHDEYGIERWRVSLSEPSRRGINQVNPMVSHIRADGHLIVVSVGHELIAIDTLGTGGRGTSKVLWRQDLTETLPGMGNNFIQQVHLRNVQMNWGVQRFFAQTPDGNPIGMSGPATLRYVSFLRRKALHVVDPLTGKTLWIRHDIDPAAEIFGDEEFLFVSPPNSDQTLVLRASDGEQVKIVSLPKVEERVAAYGRKLLSWRLEAGKPQLALRDMFTEETLWKHQYTVGAKLWPLGTDEVGVMDRKGAFQIVATNDGSHRLQATVPAEQNLSEIYVFRAPGSYLLLTNGPHRQRDGVNIQAVPGGFNNPLINGNLYGFDRKTQKQLYQTRIEAYGLTLHQPEGIPMMVFASQIYENPRNGQVRPPQAVMLCIDKRTGRVLYDKRLTAPINMIDLVGEPEKNAVVLKTMRNTMRFTFSEEPWSDPITQPDPSYKGIGAKPEPGPANVGKALGESAEGLGKVLRDAQKELDKLPKATGTANNAKPAGNVKPADGPKPSGSGTAPIPAKKE